MNPDQQNKLRQAKLNKAQEPKEVTHKLPELEAGMAEVKQSLESFSDTLASKDWSIDIEPLTEKIAEIKSIIPALEAVAESIKNLKLPEPVVNIPKSDTPVVNVKAPAPTVIQASDDIYARYDFANSSEGALGRYIGYLAHNGNWFIQRINKSMTETISKFASGSGDYKKNWRDRERLTYLDRDKVTIA